MKRRRFTAVLGAVVMTAATFTVAQSVTTAVAQTASPTFATHYAVDERACPRVSTPGAFTCMAVQRVNVPAGTPGAYRYTTPLSDPDGLHGPSGGLSPTALAKAYGFNASPSRPHQLVGIIDWYDDPNIRADLNKFDKQYGYPKETLSSLRKVNEHGHAGPLPSHDVGTSVEIALDVETVRAVCHKCRILLVEAAQPAPHDLANAVNTAARLHATEISNSYGTPEASGHPFPAYLRHAYLHHHVVVTASTGDDGWFGWDRSNSHVPTDKGASFPASSADVVSVGGTSLYLDKHGRRKTEPVWNSNGVDNSVGRRNPAVGAGGSGCSKFFQAWSWQRNAAGYSGAFCGGRRLSADVAAAGDPDHGGLAIYNSYGGPGWETIGGTSLASPLIAAMWALAGGAGGQDFPSRTLYRNLHARPAATIHDVLSGGTGWCGGDSTAHCSKAVSRYSHGATNNPNERTKAFVDCSFPRHGRVHGHVIRKHGCNSGPKVDGPSGVGSPLNVRLFESPLPQPVIHYATSIKRGTTHHYRAGVYLPVGTAHVIRIAWHWGDGHGPTVTSGRRIVTHHYTRAGTFHILLTVTDSRHQTVTVGRYEHVHG